MAVPPAGTEEVWPVWDVRAEAVGTPAGHVPTLVERGEPRLVGIADLPSDLWARELALVDATDPRDVAGFLSEYGTLTSPLWRGGGRLSDFRNRIDWSVRRLPSGPADGMWYEPYASSSLAALDGCDGRAARTDPVGGGPMPWCLPFRLSEAARAALAGDAAVAGAVSFLEAAQAVRLLQTATQAAAAVVYADLAELPDGWVADRLLDARYLSQRGAGYFTGLGARRPGKGLRRVSSVRPTRTTRTTAAAGAGYMSRARAQR